MTEESHIGDVEFTIHKMIMNNYPSHYDMEERFPVAHLRMDVIMVDLVNQVSHEI